MDSAEEFTTIEWCAGYGGIQLGLRRVIPTLRTIAYSEIEAFACANLVAKMEAGQLDAAPIWTDLKTFPCQEFRDRVDLLVAGYPCQPFSAAGKRQGADDPRHLWPFIRDAIGIVRPMFCFLENVEGHISLGLSTVVSDLEADGYRTTWGIFSAEECGAPHRRKRVFILAKRMGNTEAESAGGLLLRAKQEIASACGSGEHAELAHSNSRRRKIQGSGQLTSKQMSISNGSKGRAYPARPGQPQHEWEPPRVVANSSQRDNGGHKGRAYERQGAEHREGVSAGSVADTKGEQARRICEQNTQPDTVTNSGEHTEEHGLQRDGIREIEPALGRDADGTTDRLGDAELYESCDNRTDELRLLGNGVCPDTAELAWTVLYQRLNKG